MSAPANAICCDEPVNDGSVSVNLPSRMWDGAEDSRNPFRVLNQIATVQSNAINLPSPASKTCEPTSDDVENVYFSVDGFPARNEDETTTLKHDMEFETHNEEEFFDYGGIPLSTDGPEVLPLPHTRRTHDLASVLFDMVEMTEDGMEAKLKTSFVVAQVSVECGGMLDELGRAFNLDPNQIRALHDPLPWQLASCKDKTFYHNLFVWLNLPHKFRVDPSTRSSEHLETFPNLFNLVKVLLNDLMKHSIELEEFSCKIFKEDEIDMGTLLNLVLTPLPWDWLGNSTKQLYAKIWNFLKQPLVERMEILDKVVPQGFMETATSDEEFDYVDTEGVSRETLKFLRANGVTITEFSEKIVRFSRASVSSFLNKPIAWDRCKEYQQQIYRDMEAWLQLRDDKKMAKLSRQRTTGERRLVSGPRPGQARTKKKLKRLMLIGNRSETKVRPRAREKHAYNSSAAKDVGSAIDQDGEVLSNLMMKKKIKKEILREVGEIVRKRKLLPNEGVPAETTLDTSTIGRKMLNEMSKGFVTMRGFATQVNVNRNYLSVMVKHPSQWQKCTSIQKFVYVCMNDWLQLVKTDSTSSAKTSDRKKVVGDNEVVSDEEGKIPRVKARSQALMQLKKIKTALMDKLEPFCRVETFLVARIISDQVYKGMLSYAGMGKAMATDRHMVSSMLKHPIDWGQATHQQQFVYRCMQLWCVKNGLIADKKLNPECPTAAEGKGKEKQVHQIDEPPPIPIIPCPASGDRSSEKSEVTRPYRFKFSDFQLKYLKEAFDRNPRPTADEKQVICDDLNLPRRSVTVFFNNRRSRYSV